MIENYKKGEAIMTRSPKTKELIRTRLASTYGGWIYCDHCGQNIGYLCYITYDHFDFDYKCQCGNHGNIHIAFEEDSKTYVSNDKLITLKKRLCCPHDHSPLLIILEKKLDDYKFEIECVECKTKYQEEKVK